jgi:hypothetical protein
MIFLAFCVGFILCAFLVLLIILSSPARRPPMPTKYARRHLFYELNEGMDALASTRRDPPNHRNHRNAAERNLSREGVSDERDRVQYEWINLTGEEK